MVISAQQEQLVAAADYDRSRFVRQLLFFKLTRGGRKVVLGSMAFVLPGQITEQDEHLQSVPSLTKICGPIPNLIGNKHHAISSISIYLIAQVDS